MFPSSPDTLGALEEVENDSSRFSEPMAAPLPQRFDLPIRPGALGHCLLTWFSVETSETYDAVDVQIDCLFQIGSKTSAVSGGSIKQRLNSHKAVALILSWLFNIRPRKNLHKSNTCIRYYCLLAHTIKLFKHGCWSCHCCCCQHRPPQSRPHGWDGHRAGGRSRSCCGCACWLPGCHPATSTGQGHQRQCSFAPPVTKGGVSG